MCSADAITQMFDCRRGTRAHKLSHVRSVSEGSANTEMNSTTVRCLKTMIENVDVEKTTGNGRQV